ncbi:hypothetical protein W97_03374 [Coniosporium apollinis CBS 100218]|uniref:Ig-like domain-containing protein n=1 Tax=Coniosporium apollinis (strain CBS 100218) TaxID=1168221 RepID=R7YQS3_CONA1|nr:uncharacterized protein W97_03374 [Coniosporium apollinis CBS 100218]EON64144.1 hypothetical protein W97_03374 [Coniosporium apollinis CBS 100218]
MKSLPITLPFFLAAVYAQSSASPTSSTVSVWWPDTPIDGPFNASVVNVGNGRTTLAVACAEPSETRTCSIIGDLTMTFASDYFGYATTLVQQNTAVLMYSAECTVGGDASATCTATRGGRAIIESLAAPSCTQQAGTASDSEGSSAVFGSCVSAATETPPATTTTFATADGVETVPIVVTAGVELLASAGVAVTTATVTSTGSSAGSTAELSLTLVRSEFVPFYSG